METRAFSKSLKINGPMDGTIEWGIVGVDGAYIGLANNVTADRKPWMHIGGYHTTTPNTRRLGLFADTYVSGNLHVKGHVYVKSREK